jgi:hypothetical protein
VTALQIEERLVRKAGPRARSIQPRGGARMFFAGIAKLSREKHRAPRGRRRPTRERGLSHIVSRRGAAIVRTGDGAFSFMRLRGLAAKAPPRATNAWARFHPNGRERAVGLRSFTFAGRHKYAAAHNRRRSQPRRPRTSGRASGTSARHRPPAVPLNCRLRAPIERG